MKIAILGGGHGCYAAAADLSEAGHEVRLWRRDAQALKPVIDAGSITLKDADGAREVKIARATADIGEALRDARLIVIPSPAIAQDDIARAMAPHLVDGQVVFLPPGTFGSLTMIAHRARGRQPGRRGLGRDRHAALSRTQARRARGQRHDPRGAPAHRRVSGAQVRRGHRA